MQRPGPILAILLSATASIAAAERPLFTASTEFPERPRQREVKPNAELVRLMLIARGREDIPLFDECLAREHLPPRDYGSLMYAIPIRSGSGRTLWFVRGSLDRWCIGLYGAHAFSYFLIDERAGRQPRYRLVLDGGGDHFAIYPTRHHGLNDIEMTGCRAFDCDSSRMVFNGRRYRAIRCTSTSWDDHHREIRRRWDCNDPWIHA